MSYILEALKKAQAERQLGNAPTIHAPSPSYAPPVAAGSRKPLLVGLGAGALVVAAGAVFLLRQPPVAAPVQVASAPAPAIVVPAPEPVPVPVPVAVPVPPPAAPVAQPEPARPKQAAARVQPEPLVPVAEPEPEPPRRAQAVEPAPDAPRAAVLPAAPPGADDSVGPAQSLPDAVQRELPKVAFGGYIYSPNPAERLLLVDKMLRREGEEIAPGLVLERLLPKAAIMNFRGYRYRVAY